MTNFVEVSIKTNSIEEQEQFIALLEPYFIGFEQQEHHLIAFAETNTYDHQSTAALLNQLNSTFTVKELVSTNWNKQWEENFEPVIVDGFCTVRADFHHIPIRTPFEIIITPKMSFGTGHHATTQLVMQIMQTVSFEEKKVLDFGTGTGILAILASKLGANQILAIDNDEWSIENASENVLRNEISNVQVSDNTLADFGKASVDIVLANINRHVLLDNMDSLFGLLSIGGVLVMSGILISDEAVLLEAARSVGFEIISVKQIGEWIAVHCAKR
ncbi:MAG: 50S ribosomal protein L11 methyltransferase [Bacteroidetes bacterium]|nr:50S ribosomal protein L11 methyltransferase [Bacteroidota bacterium]